MTVMFILGMQQALFGIQNQFLKSHPINRIKKRENVISQWIEKYLTQLNINFY